MRAARSPRTWTARAVTPPPADSAAPVVPLGDEEAVVRRLQRGDRAALATLYGWYGDRLYRAILRYLPRPEAAEDVLKDTFRTALERIDTFSWQGRSIYPWLRRIGVNKALDLHRRTTRERAVTARVQAEPELVVSAPPRPDRALEADEAARDVGVVLDRLHDRYATALRLRLLEGHSREACAAQLDVSVATFDVLFHRACKAFRNGWPP
jgi:RNA polymerase sigma factor (sigma-70 family)